ncbi:helix-turn-helix domain-containing protein [Metabacillus endolithicus]|uniref:helix-turn-helix domain-containing protein n=1 Tax=Metabacillus endolithicus TaxID=1535204 RepID=UPI0031F09CB5
MENILERVMLTTDEEIIYPEHLPATIKKEHLSETTTLPFIDHHIDEEHNLKKAVEQVEKRLLYKAMERCKTTYEMAKYLGISQPSIVRKLKQYSINMKEERKK